MRLAKEPQIKPKDNIFNTKELQGLHKQNQATCTVTSTTSPFFLRALLHWCSLLKGDRFPAADPPGFLSFCSNCSQRAGSRFSLPRAMLGARYTSWGPRPSWASAAHWEGAFLVPRQAQLGGKNSCPQDLSQLLRQNWVTFLDGTKLLSAPAPQQESSSREQTCDHPHRDCRGLSPGRAVQGTQPVPPANGSFSYCEQSPRSSPTCPSKVGQPPR